MTAKMTRNILLMLVATVLMGIVLNLYIHNTGTVPAADNAAPLTDGSYTSSAQGCLSEVTVTVTVTGGKVTAVQVDASAETPELGGKAAETLAAQLTQDRLHRRCGRHHRFHHDQRGHLYRHGRLPCTGAVML